MVRTFLTSDGLIRCEIARTKDDLHVLLHDAVKLLGRGLRILHRVFRVNVELDDLQPEVGTVVHAVVLDLRHGRYVHEVLLGLHTTSKGKEKDLPLLLEFRHGACRPRGVEEDRLVGCAWDSNTGLNVEVHRQ
jgi:hypothetical protein